MTYKKFITTSLLAIFLATTSPFSALAQVDISTSEKNYAPAVEKWTKYSAVNVQGDGRVRLALKNSESGHLYTNVDIPENDDYAVFVAYARAEKPYSSDNIASLPYLYAYFLDEDGKIVEYVAETSMRQNSIAGKSWQVIYGIVDVPKDSESMRLFLKQASRKGTTPDGRAAWFYKPGLFFVDSSSEASKIVTAYSSELGEVEDLFPVYSTSASNHNDDINYPEGALLKCQGESEIYSVTSSNTLKLFPDEETFFAWGHYFYQVQTISCDRLDDYTVSGTWTYTRADYLVKFRGQPAVYTLDNGEYLRVIPDEYTARKMYGSNWTNLVREYSINEMDKYTIAAPHKSLRK